MIEFDFTGKIVVITGAAGDIGSVTAKSFHDDGAAVCLLDIDEAALEAKAAGLGLSPERSMLIKTDVTDESSVSAAVDAVVARFGKIDILFNNAGKQGPGARIEDIDIKQFESCMKLNVTGVLIMLKYVLPVMYRQRGGCVINTSSQAGIRAQAGGSAYSVSKAACMKIGAIAAMEAGEYNVRVNTICPGALNSRMMQNTLQNVFGGDLDAMLSRGFPIPLGRMGELEEVAALVKFLASDEAGYISGLDAVINGGSTAR